MVPSTGIQFRLIIDRDGFKKSDILPARASWAPQSKVKETVENTLYRLNYSLSSPEERERLEAERASKPKIQKVLHVSDKMSAFSAELKQIEKEANS